MYMTRRSLAGLLISLLAAGEIGEIPVNSGWANDFIRSITLPTGATSGARIVIDGGSDRILMYNTANELVASISPTIGADPTGNVYHAGITTYQRTDNVFVELSTVTADLVFGLITGDNMGAGMGIIPDVVDGVCSLAITCTSPTRGGPQINMQAGNGSTFLDIIQATQQLPNPPSASVSGCLINNDDQTGGTHPKFVHKGHYTATVSGAAGLITFAHGCAFTPKVGEFTPISNFTQGTMNPPGSFTTNAFITCLTAGGAFVPNGTLVEFYAGFWA